MTTNFNFSVYSSSKRSILKKQRMKNCSRPISLHQLKQFRAFSSSLYFRLCLFDLPCSQKISLSVFFLLVCLCVCQRKKKEQWHKSQNINNHGNRTAFGSISMRWKVDVPEFGSIFFNLFGPRVSIRMLFILWGIGDANAYRFFSIHAFISAKKDFFYLFVSDIKHTSTRKVFDSRTVNKKYSTLQKFHILSLIRKSLIMLYGYEE